MDSIFGVKDKGKFTCVNFACGQFADEVTLCLGKDQEIKIDENKVTVVKVKPKYPTTYEECCRIINASPFVKLVYNISDGQTYSYDVDNLRLYENIRQLKICRDCYWRITGKELGLNKPWEPENPSKRYVFTIESNGGKIIRNAVVDKMKDRFLTFYSEEIRDAFHDNFKILIESCKEFL